MDGTDEDVLLRMRENAGAFEAQSDMKDAKVNDGENYRGMMSAADYRKRRQEVLEGVDDEQRKREKTMNAAMSALQADRDAAVQAAREREERERLRKEKLRKQLEAEDDEQQQGEGGDGGVPPAEQGKKKKKKKKPNEAGAGLSFDADDS